MTGSERDILDLPRAAVAAGRRGESLEAYAEWSRSVDVKVFRGAVESLSSAETRGLGVRLLVEGRLGYAYMADPSPDEVAGLVERARANAAMATPDEANILPVPQPIEPLDGIFSERLAATPMKRKVQAALDLERACLATDTRVSGVESAEYGDGIGHVGIASTAGVEVQARRGDCWAGISSMASQGDETQTGFSLQYARALEDLDLEATAREAAMRAVRLLGARKPKTEKMPVLLDPFAAASFLGVLAAGLTGEAVLKGRSLFAGKLGQVVASEVFSLVDDGRELKGPGATPFDDEGVPTRRTPLISGGVLQGFLHNTYTGGRMGVGSTGNGMRGGFKSPPGVSPSNLFVEPGTEDVDALLARAGRALLVQDLIGVHSGANPISGDFSVGISGLIVEGGEMASPVREAAVASTVLDILRGIVAVGSDVRFLGSIGSPTLLVGEMTVAGA